MSRRREEKGVPAPQPSLPRIARKCSLGCPILDSFLKGGIPCGSITELVGECGSAKTQICLQLLLSAQMPLSHGGLHGSSLYIYTESYFPSKRLQQLAKGFLDAGKLEPGSYHSQKKHPCLQNGMQEGYAEKESSHNSIRNHSHTHVLPSNLNVFESDGDGMTARDRMTDLFNERTVNLCNLQKKSSDRCIELYSDELLSKQERNGVINDYDGEFEDSIHPCDNIFVQSIQNIEELCVFLDQVHLLLSRPLGMPVRLLIIDSVAALFRSDFDNNVKDLAMRTEWFFKLSSKLKQYAHDYDIAVLVTNQVVDDVDSESLEKQSPLGAMLSGRSGPLRTAGRRVIPALGIGWSHCVNTRLFLSRTYVRDGQTYSHSLQIGRMENSSGCSSNSHYRNVDCNGMVSEPQISVLQQLESELPDDLLLTLSYKRSCNGINDKPNVIYDGEREKGEVLGHTSLQDGCQTRNNWSSYSKSLASCSVRRELQVVFAPHLLTSSCEFVVKATQVCGVSAALMQPLCNKVM